MTRSAPIRSALTAALLLAAAAPPSHAEDPAREAAFATHELAHVLQQQREQIARAQALLGDAGVTSRDAAAGASDGVDALEATLVAEHLLPAGATQAVAERGMGMNKVGPVAGLQKTAPAPMQGASYTFKNPGMDMQKGAASTIKNPTTSTIKNPATSTIKNPAASTIKNPAASTMKNLASAVPPAAATPSKQELQAVALLIGNRAPSDLLLHRWQRALEGAGEGADVNALVQQTLAMSMRETQRDLAYYAEKVRYYNEMKKSMREQIDQLRAERARAKASDRSRLDALIAGWEDRLQAIGDDAEVANVDLQNMLQKQQEALQTMAKISKQLHDTAMAVIRKTGG